VKISDRKFFSATSAWRAASRPIIRWRAIRTLIDEALNGLSRDFNKLYARDGRPSIPPERLLRALLLQAFYTVRSERQFDGATQLQSVVPVVRRALGG